MLCANSYAPNAMETTPSESSQCSSDSGFSARTHPLRYRSYPKSASLQCYTEMDFRQQHLRVFLSRYKTRWSYPSWANQEIRQAFRGQYAPAVRIGTGEQRQTDIEEQHHRHHIREEICHDECRNREQFEQHRTLYWVALSSVPIRPAIWFLFVGFGVFRQFLAGTRLPCCCPYRTHRKKPGYGLMRSTRKDNINNRLEQC